MAAIPVPVHFDGHTINIITEDSLPTDRTKCINYGNNIHLNKGNIDEINGISTSVNITNGTASNNNNNITLSTNASLLPLASGSNNTNNVETEAQSAPLNVAENSKINAAALMTNGALNERKSPQLPLPAPHQQQMNNNNNMNKGEVDGMDPNDDSQNLYKTELCREWSSSGWCYYNKRCSFAHGLQELRPVFRSKKWRTKRCRNWDITGYCPYQHRCQFLHGQSPPRRILDPAIVNDGASVAAQQRMQPLYFHYQVAAQQAQ